jgi:hypothetical protein
MLIHELSAPGEALGRDIGAIGGNVPRPLVVDFIRPAGLKEVHQRKPHEEVA